MSMQINSSDFFNVSKLYTNIANTVAVAGSLSQGVGFFLSQVASSKLVQQYAMPYMAAFPNQAMDRVGQEAAPIRPYSSVLSAGVATIASWALCAISTNCLVNGAVYGAHSVAMMYFCNNGAGSVKELAGGVVPAREHAALSAERMATIEGLSKAVSGLAFFVSSVTLTVFSQNPILANGVAYPVAAAVEVFAKRALMECSEEQFNKGIAAFKWSIA